MNLREICSLKVGEPIYGVHVDLKKRKKYLNKDGWVISSGSLSYQLPFTESESFFPDKDSTVILVNFFYVPNLNLMDMKNIYVVPSIDNECRSTGSVDGQKLEDYIDTSFLTSNSKHLKSIVSEKLVFETIPQGNPVGVSLGETILFVIPSETTYKRGYSAICCLHKMIFMQKIVWACFNATIPTNFYEKFFSNLPDAKMEI